jgi:Pro-kumamolisin, activation domain/Putative Ig domain
VRAAVKLPGCLIVVVATLATACAPNAMAGAISIGRPAALPRAARVEGAVAPARRLQLTVALSPSRSAQLAALATAVSTPGSPQFHHYLTVGEFAHRFGAPASHVGAVRRYLVTHGLSVERVLRNRLALQVSGSAASVERAFDTLLESVRVAGITNAYADVRAPELPATIARDVQGVDGLSDVDTPASASDTATASPDPAVFGPLSASAGAAPSQARSNSVPRTAGYTPTPCAAAKALTRHPSSAALAYRTGETANEFATAYELDGLYSQGDAGAGQVVAVVEEHDYEPNAVATYQSCYGTSASVSAISVQGGAAPASTSSNEAQIDIEGIIGLVPKASVLVYEAPSAYSAIAQIASDNRARVVSVSYIDCDYNPALSTSLEEAAAQGQSVFDSSGDQGSTTCSSSAPPTVNAISEQPDITGVGGTSLYSDSSGQIGPYLGSGAAVEGVWNDGSGGSGGGVSTIVPMPGYQSSAAPTLGVINADSSGAGCGTTYCREVPDVSADADSDSGYVIYSNGRWLVDGGTSAAAPLWAAFTALANASPACINKPALGFLNPDLYAIASSNYAANFNDVTHASPNTGEDNNDLSGATGDLYPVTAGYDMATGLGSMQGTNLAESLCGGPVPTVTVQDPGAQIGVVRYPASTPVHALDSVDATLTFTAAGLPTGLQINSATGVITGTPTAAGSFAVTVAATDGDRTTGSTSFVWQISQAPTESHASLTGVAKRRAQLTFDVTGSPINQLTAFKLLLPSGVSLNSKVTKLLSIRGANGQALRYRISARRSNTVSVALPTPSQSIVVNIPAAALNVSNSLAHRVRNGGSRQLLARVIVTTEHGGSLQLTLRLPQRA